MWSSVSYCICGHPAEAHNEQGECRSQAHWACKVPAGSGSPVCEKYIPEIAGDKDNVLKSLIAHVAPPVTFRVVPAFKWGEAIVKHGDNTGKTYVEHKFTIGSLLHGDITEWGQDSFDLYLSIDTPDACLKVTPKDTPLSGLRNDAVIFLSGFKSLQAAMTYLATWLEQVFSSTWNIH